jgi:hypothetical protein
MMDWSLDSGFDRLGAGSFATVFAWRTRPTVALKQVAQNDHESQLRKEYDLLCEIHAASLVGRGADSDMLFEPPRPFNFYTSYWEFARDFRLDRSIQRGLDGTSSLYTMRRLLPIPPALAANIQSSFFPESHRGGDPPAFIARIYLGRKLRQDGGGRFHSHANFPLDEARLQQLSCEYSATTLARAMARTLACMHYLAGVDGRDIEFVLGGDTDNPLQKARCLVIDFNQVRRLQDEKIVEQIVSAIVDNDPYVPRPNVSSAEVWDAFCATYVEDARERGSARHGEIAAAVLKQLAEHWTSASVDQGT